MKSKIHVTTSWIFFIFLTYLEQFPWTSGRLLRSSVYHFVYFVKSFLSILQYWEWFGLSMLGLRISYNYCQEYHHSVLKKKRYENHKSWQKISWNCNMNFNFTKFLNKYFFGHFFGELWLDNYLPLIYIQKYMKS